MRGFRIAALACALLAPASVARAECRIIAEAPLRGTLGFLSVPVSIRDAPASLLLDTGAESGLVTAEAARGLGLPADPSHLTRVEGTGGVGAVLPHAILEGVALGGIALPPRSVPVGPLPAIPRIAPPIAGLMGADTLAAFDVEIDLLHGRLALHEPGADCVPSWPHAAVPLRREGDRLAATALLDGKPLEALIDTGALSVILDTESAYAFGVSAAELARDPGGITGGVDMRQTEFHWHRFASLAVGPVVIHNPVITVAPVRERTPMLLGASWFAERRVWLSFATARIFVGR